MSDKSNFLLCDRVAVLLSIAIVFIGLFFRFANIADKIFWVDEVATAVRVSGYTISEVTSSLIQQDIVDRNTLLSYLDISNDRTFINSLSALTKSPEHAPLYFILTRFWMQIWGNSIAVMRSLSIVFGVLILPSLYWFCRELFNKSLICWLSIGIISISPFHVAYAQEARPYSLWTVTILLMGASFLRAVRLNNQSAWWRYSLCLAIGLYTSLFSVYVALFQGIYLLATTNKKRWQIIASFVRSATIGFIAFVPWILVIINSLDLLHDNTSWMRGNFNLADIIAVYIGTNLLVFGDLPLSQDINPIQIAVALVFIVGFTLAGIKLYPRVKSKFIKFVFLLSIISLVVVSTKYFYLDWTTIIGALVAIAILSLSVYSLYYLIVRENKRRWLYIICLMLSLPVPLLITDIINQGQSSTAPRYLIPLQLGILIAVSYTVAHKLSVKQNKSWQFIAAAFLCLGIYSNVRNLNLAPFYQKGRNVNNPAIAKIINRSDSALVIVESTEAMDAVSLAYSLNPGVKYKVINTEDNLNYTNNFDSIYLLKPTSKLKQKLNTNSQIKLRQIYKSHIFSEDEFPLDLWLIEYVKA